MSDESSIILDAQSNSPALFGDSPELVSAIELDQWANRTAAKTLFPELMRRLFAQTPGVTNLEIRVREGTSAPGWDGVATSTGSAYLPAGELRCEFGTNQKVKPKADSDYAKRAKELGAEASKYVYVFATPRNWPSGQKWVEERRAERKFADVKVIDAHTLEGWLQETPAVHYWLSEQLGKCPCKAQTLQAWWTIHFQKEAKITIPPQFFLARRDEQVQELIEALQTERPTTAVAVASTCDQDVLAFVHAVLMEQMNLLDRTVIVTDQRVWSHLMECKTSLLLIPIFNDPYIGSALERGHKVLIVVNDDKYSQINATISLPKVGRRETEEALRESGVDFRRAGRMAALARRSMTAFLRSISRNPAVQKPAWLNNQGAVTILAPLVLVGAWEDENDRDKKHIEHFVKVSMATIRDLMVSLSHQKDSPFVQSGSVWRLVDPIDAAQLLLPMIGSEIIERWQKLACDVLLAENSYQGVDRSERFAAEICKVNSDCSDTLRRHVAEGLALIASSSGKYVSGVRCIVKRLLNAAFVDTKGYALARLASVLPLLAEAAPDEFLTAITADFDKPVPIIRTLFEDADMSNFFFGPSSLHHNLQWALERLCWSEEYYGRAAMLLARLAALDPGGRLGGRPIDSLERVTAGWIAQSAADVDDKIAVVEQTMRRYPKVGWHLALALLKPDRTMALADGPGYRNWELPDLSVTHDEWHRFTEKALELTIKAATDNPNCWTDLIELSHHLSKEDRLVLFQSLLDVVRSFSQSWSDDDRHAMWSVLTEEIAHHETRSNTMRAMTNTELAILREVAQKVARTDDPRQYARLFGWGIDLVLNGLHWNDDGFDVVLEAEQRRALEKVANQGLAAVQALIADVERPELVGELLAQTDPADNADIIVWLNDREPSKRRRTAQAYVSTMAREHGKIWLADVMNYANLEFEGQAALVAAVPMEERYWTWIATLNEALIAAYWRTADHRWVPENERTKAVDLLVEHGSPWRALDILWKMNDGDFSRAFAATKNALNTCLAFQENFDLQHYSYVVSDLLARLEKISSEDPELVRLEFWFFDFIEGNRESSKALYRFFGNNPKEFVSLIKKIYHEENKVINDQDVKDRVFMRLYFNILYEWKSLPGIHNDGSIDSGHLYEWILECRKLLNNCNRIEVGDQEIGKVLASSPVGNDGVWPAEEVRNVLENLKNSNIESGLVVGRCNQREMSVRGIYDGGARERGIAQKYRDSAKRVEMRWPRTAEVLRQVAKSYECFARHLDEQVERRADEG